MHSLPELAYFGCFVLHNNGGKFRTFYNHLNYISSPKVNEPESFYQRIKINKGATATRNLQKKELEGCNTP